MMTKTNIVAKLPYTKPFLFVDEIIDVNEEYIKAHYTFLEDEFFYEGHFKDNPVTPGVILTECMAQIGMACLGIYLLKDTWDDENWQVAMTNSQVDFYKPVFPGEKVIVTANKVYFRFNKLKCDVIMHNANDSIVAKGTVAGMAFKK